jgi:hypothetical protein
MAAKFRCLCSAIDYYFYDGGEGLFQGSLTLGKETTINTYEGHRFFFTERGNKETEISWHTMVKNQVSPFFFFCSILMFMYEATNFI